MEYKIDKMHKISTMSMNCNCTLNTEPKPPCPSLLVKMAKYHHFQKFVAKKHCFGTKWKSTTFYVLELTKLEFSKLEFLVSFHCDAVDLEFVQ